MRPPSELERELVMVMVTEMVIWCDNVVDWRCRRILVASLCDLLVPVTRCGDGVALVCYALSPSEDIHVSVSV